MQGKHIYTVDIVQDHSRNRASTFILSAEEHSCGIANLVSHAPRKKHCMCIFYNTHRPRDTAAAAAAAQTICECMSCGTKGGAYDSREKNWAMCQSH
eukprot:scaffold11663_cov21-Tisochrysis_lutea.AAC.1